MAAIPSMGMLSTKKNVVKNFKFEKKKIKNEK